MKSYKAIINEAKRGKNVKVPNFKTEKQAYDFVKKLGPDDTTNDDVVNPLTGEVIWKPKQTKRDIMKKGYKRDQKDAFWDDPTPMIDFFGRNDYESEREMENFYNIVYKDIADLIDKESLKTVLAGDYDPYQEIPRAISRKDGKKFDEYDVDNIKNFIEYRSERLGNIKLYEAPPVKQGKKRVMFDFTFT